MNQEEHRVLERAANILRMEEARRVYDYTDVQNPYGVVSGKKMIMDAKFAIREVLSNYEILHNIDDVQVER
jgi:hypothetical protein